jgi:hypothetical protein
MRDAMCTLLAAAAALAVSSLAACSSPAPSSLEYGYGGHGAPAQPPSADPSAAPSGSNAPPPVGASGKTLPCDVAAVLTPSCQGCHGSKPAFGASVPLVTWDDLHATPLDSQAAIYTKVGARIHDAANPMPPTPYPKLDAQSTATLDAWIAAGAPPGDGGTCAAMPAPPPKPTVQPLPCTPDTQIRPAAPYAVSKDLTDQYVCYGFDVTTATKRHVVALGPRIDNTSVVHHLLLFQSPTSVSSTPAPCSAGGSTQWRMVSGWAPGGQNMVLPKEAGFAESGTTHWVMQVHYNNARALDGQSDQSGFDLCTTDQLRANDADVMAFGSINFSIPPRATLTQTCDYTVPQGTPALHLFSASPHMHTLGKAMTTTKMGGAPQTIVTQPSFSFQTQLAYPTSVDLAAGDTVETACTWQNAGDTTVSFGENTSNEMCFDFVAYYPAITSPLFSWVTPSVLASCH